LFLRHQELNLTMIVQTSDICYEQLKEKSIPDFSFKTINYVLMLPEKNRNNKVLLHNLFGMRFGSYQDFDDIFSQITNNETLINGMILERGETSFSYLTISSENKNDENKEDDKSNESYDKMDNLVNYDK
jgi:hypothetical protein